MTKVDDMLARRGENWTVQRWTSAGTDEYENATFTLGAGATVRAIRVEPGQSQERIVMTFQGRERTIEVQLHVRSNHAWIVEAESNQLKSPVLTSPSGIMYDAVAVGREAEQSQGMVRLFLAQHQ